MACPNSPIPSTIEPPASGGLACADISAGTANAARRARMVRPPVSREARLQLSVSTISSRTDDCSRTCSGTRCRKAARENSSFAAHHSAPSHASMTENSIGMMDGTGCSRSAGKETLRFLPSVRIHGIANQTKAASWRAALKPNPA